MHYMLNKGKNLYPESEKLLEVYRAYDENLILQKNGSYMNAQRACFKFYGGSTCSTADSCYVWIDANCAKAPNIDGVDIIKLPFVLQDGYFEFNKTVKNKYFDGAIEDFAGIDLLAEQQVKKEREELMSFLLDTDQSVKKQEFLDARRKRISDFNQVFIAQYNFDGKIIPTVDNLVAMIKKRCNLVMDRGQGIYSFADGTCVDFVADGVCSENGNCRVNIDVNCTLLPNKDGEDIFRLPFYVDGNGRLRFDRNVMDSYIIVQNESDEEYMYK